MAEKKAATTVETPVDSEIKKSLDENLEAMNELIKSKDEDADIDALLKSDENRKKIAAKMKGYEKKDEEDEDESEEDESEDEDEAPAKSKIKKSLEDVVAANDEVIDAVPVLKSFTEVLSQVIDKLDEVAELKKSVRDIFDIQKSFGATEGSVADLLKSIDERLGQIASTPLPVKGAVRRDQVLTKSFTEDGEEMTKSYPMEVVRETLLKSVQAGEISANVVGKWELSGYRFEALPAKEQKIILNKLNKGVIA